MAAGRNPLLARAGGIAYIRAMKRNILLHPDPRLKKVAKPVADLTDDLRALSDDMLKTMYEAPGIGLAAPQVGVLDRLIVLDCVKEEGEAPRPLVMFNPVVTASSDETNTYEEGCLSVPDIFEEIERPTECRIRYLNYQGEEVEEVATGLFAVCIQHEMDHLAGVVTFDRIDADLRAALEAPYLAGRP